METLNKTKIKALLQGCPTEGFAEIVLKNPKKTGTITVRDYSHVINEEGDIVYRPFVDSNGNNRVVKYTKKKRLNLANENDRLEYMQVKLHPLYVNGSTPSLIVKNLEEEAKDFIEKKDMASDANAIVKNLSGNELVQFARVLLIRINVGSSDSTIKRAIYEIAEEDPTRILEEWNDDDRSYKELVRCGLIKGIFSNKNGRWLADKTSMGGSFEEAIQWLKDNEDLVPNLRKLTFGK